MPAKKKVTRIMRVTLDEDEFEKYDKGITHSDSGLRNDSGRLSALPDIAPINDEDLPKREVIVTRDRYIQPPEPSLGQMLKQEAKYAAYYAITDAIHDIIYDPRKRAILWNRAKSAWNSLVEWVRPSDRATVARKEDLGPHYATRQNQETIEYEVETVDENNQRIVVTGEQAEELVNALRQKARELSSMIFLLSNTAVKDEKSESDFILEENCIKQLVSEEATNTMRLLVAQKQLLDEGTAICFTDFLDGFVRNGDRRIPIPALPEVKEIHAREMQVD